MRKISLGGLRAGATKLSTQLLVLLLIGGMVAFVAVFILQTVQIKKMEGEYQQKKTELAAIQERNDRLQEHLDFYNSPGYMLYVEKVAREALGMAKPGETVILTVTDNAGPPSPSTAVLVATKPDLKANPDPLTAPTIKKPSWQNWFGFFFN